MKLSSKVTGAAQLLCVKLREVIGSGSYVGKWLWKEH